MASKATKAKAVATVAPYAANAVVILAVGLGAYFLVGKALPKLGNLAGDLALEGGQALAGGTKDFLSGVFTGADQTETTVPAIRDAADLGTVYQLPDPNLSSERLGSDPVFVPVAPSAIYDYRESPGASYSVDFDDFGPVVTVTNPSPAIPPPVFYEIEDPSLAQRAGGGFADWMTGPISGPVISKTKDLIGSLF